VINAAARAIRGNRKIIRAWTMYDWANSVYSLSIVTAIFPLYLIAVTSAGAELPEGVTSDNVPVGFFGSMVKNGSIIPVALSVAFLIAAAISPLLSAIADYTGNKKAYMRFFCYLGAGSCASLYFFTGPENLEFGTIAFVLASIGFTGSIVFYNAYLPEIAEEKDQDRVSARGFAMGYIGSMILLVVNLLLIMFPEIVFDVATKKAELAALHPAWTAEELEESVNGHFSGISSRLAFLEVGLWWFGFAHISFARLPKNVYNKRPSGNYLLNGYRELGIVWRQLIHLKHLRLFLIAFFFYSMAMQTILYLASVFGSAELHLETSFLILSILVIQLVAIAGAYLFSALSSRYGNINTLVYAVVFWALVSTGAYFITSQWEFLAAAFAVGLVMGGTQALSRSTYSKLLPETQDHASFFAFYDVAEKIAIVLGTGCFALMNELTGSMRNALFPIILFFVIGMMVLMRVRMRQFVSPVASV
jgi:UMF1 family MFS transporter